MAGFELDATVPLLAALLSVPLPDRYAPLQLSPEGQRKKTLALLTEWLLRLARQQPVVFLVEDLHWVDPSSIELLGQLLEQLPRERVLLLLLTFRPDFAPPWPGRADVTPMLLSRLTRRQLGQLVRKAARGRELPDAWVEEILARSDGVPLFAEEMTRAVLESNPDPERAGEAPQLRIPETLQDSLMARLDALGPLKELAQVASVLGREFDYELLLAVSPLKEAELQRALAAAVREELIYQRGTPPKASYLFRHALIRDAAYESMLRATRQRHHRRVAETLVEQMPAVAETQPELVAHHFSAADETEQALDWWERAGEAARARVAHEEAIRHLRTGLQEIARLPEGAARDARELDLLVPLGTSLAVARGYAHDETKQAFERALEISDEKEEPRRAGIIRYYLAGLHGNAGRFEQSLELFRDCERIGREHGDELLMVAGLGDPGQIYTFMPRLGEEIRGVETACEIYTPERCDFLGAGFTEDVGISTWAWLAFLRWWAGYAEGSQLAIDRADALADRLGDPYTHLTVRFYTAMLAALRRDWARARHIATEASSHVFEQGFAMYESFAALVEAWAVGVGDADPGALDRFREALVRQTSTGTTLGAPIVLGASAQLQLVTGHTADAAETAEGALRIAEAMGQHVYDPELHRLRAKCFLQLPDRTLDDAERELRRAIEIARSQGSRSLELRVATSLARLWRDQGKHVEARELLQPVYAWFTEGFDTQDLKDAKALLEEPA